MMYIRLVVILFAVLLLCLYLYRRNHISPDQKFLNNMNKMNKVLDKRIKKQKKNIKKCDEYKEQIILKIKDNNDKLNRLSNTIKNRE